MPRKPAFTIVELLVTVSIIAILLAVVTVYLGSGQVTARDARRLSDVSLIAKMVDTSMAVRRGAFPLYDDASPNLATVCADELSANAANQLDLSLFSSSGTPAIPRDPKPVAARTAGHCPDTSQGYVYLTQTSSGPATEANALGRGYVLQVALEKGPSSGESQFARDPGATQPASRTVYRLLGPVP